VGEGKERGEGSRPRGKGEVTRPGLLGLRAKPEGRVLLFLFSVPLFLLKTKPISKHFQNQI